MLFVGELLESPSKTRREKHESVGSGSKRRDRQAAHRCTYSSRSHSSGIVRSTTGIESIASYGARALMTDVFDPAAVEEVTRNSQPGIVIDQLPSLPRTPADLPRPLPADRKLRLEGRGNRAG